MSGPSDEWLAMQAEAREEMRRVNERIERQVAIEMERRSVFGQIREMNRRFDASLDRRARDREERQSIRETIRRWWAAIRGK